MPTDVPEDRLYNEEAAECDRMTLSTTWSPTVRRGSTPLPIKHQLRREEAVHDDCDWTSGAAGPSVSPISFSPALDDTVTVDVEGRRDGPCRIALLGQNGGYVRLVTVDDEESTIIIYDNWRQDLSALQCEVCVLVFSVTDRRSFHRTAQLRLLLRETQPQTPIILVGNKKALSSAALFNCLYLEISASLDHRTQELLECVVRLTRGQSPWPPGTSAEDMSGSQRGSITSRAKRFLSSLVPRYPRERDVSKFMRQKSRSCHDLGAL
ncbi:hypothetical protein FQN60_013184 [Etheostoma spectabile]|uniref:Uncharacterized protein n=1 Tax=Etheostoma spectabile TaxID=54343 RepID=A0A5J5D8N6_9PERO|nr:hypothetical protein FQN60_013184 [Etheostoma spectabile]